MPEIEPAHLTGSNPFIAGASPGRHSALAGWSRRANNARNDLGGQGFAFATRTVWEDWANVPSGDDGGPGLYHKVGHYPKPLMTLHVAMIELGNMEELLTGGHAKSQCACAGF